MSQEFRRILGLNLALVLLFGAALPLCTPARASETTDYTVAGQAYTGSDSGEGWSYNGKTDTLTLSGYQGGAIAFEDPASILFIAVEGECAVTAQSGAAVSAKNSISVSFTPGASLTLTGGAGAAAMDATANGYIQIGLPGVLTAAGGGVAALQAKSNVKIGVNNVLSPAAELTAGADAAHAADIRESKYDGQVYVSMVCTKIVYHFSAGDGGALTDPQSESKTVDWASGPIPFPEITADEGKYLASWSAPSASFSDASTGLYEGQSATPKTPEITLTARYGAIPDGEYVFFQGGGVRPNSAVALPSTGKLTMPDGTFRTGWKLIGWTADPSYELGERVSGLYWPQEVVSNLQGGATLYAVASSSKYTPYYANGGAAGDGFTRLAIRQDAPVPSVESLFTRQGFRPGGWNTKADGTGSAYAAGDYAGSESVSVSLYAQWVYDRAVCYHGNGGLSSGKETLLVNAESATLAAQGFSQTGRAFLGWSLTPDGAPLSALPQISSGQTLDLYALWGGSAVTCYGKAWGPGNILVDKTTVLAAQTGESVTLPVQYESPVTYPFRGPVAFNGWNTKSDFTGQWYGNGAQVTVTGAMTLFAQYIDLSETTDALLFVSYGFFGGQNYLRVPTEDGALTLPDTMDGVQLVGWARGGNFGSYEGAAYLPGESVANAAGKIFMAVCEEQAYAGNWINCYLLYNGNGGTRADGEETVFFTVSNMSLVDFGPRLYDRERVTGRHYSKSPLTRPGYLLTGWNTKPDGSGEALDLNDPYSAYGKSGVYGYVFYAQWTPSEASVEVPEAMQEIRSDPKNNGVAVCLSLYDEAGRFLRCCAAQGTHAELESLPEDAATGRFFCLDSDSKPKSAAEDALIPVPTP